MSKTTTIAKLRADGTIGEVMSDGSERPFPDTPMREMTEAEIEAAAAADPDARPMTPAELRTARRVPRVKTLRRALGLTQQEFAARYQIPLGTLRDWEQSRTEPDQPARAYLTVIAHDPEGARRAFQGFGMPDQPQNPADRKPGLVTPRTGHRSEEYP
jgi:putative transcriptional regulator